MAAKCLKNSSATLREEGDVTPSKETGLDTVRQYQSVAKLWRDRETQILLAGVRQTLWRVIWKVLVKLKTHFPFDSAVL